MYCPWPLVFIAGILLAVGFADVSYFSVGVADLTSVQDCWVHT